MKTDPIYMLKPYEKSMDAKILEIFEEGNNQYRLILDKTVFYPMGGGQPTDQGTLKLEDGTELEVFQVMVKEGEINHFVKMPVTENYNSPQVGVNVTGTIDWERRYKHMKLHSAGHIIDFAMYLLGYSPNKITPLKADHGKKPYIVYGINPDSAHLLDNGLEPIAQALQTKVEELIKQNLQFSWEFESLEKLEKEAIYLQPNLPTNKPMRVLRLEGVGAVADGGTIVERTGEVGGVQVTNIEEKDGQLIVSYEMRAASNADNGLQPIEAIKPTAYRLPLNDDFLQILQSVQTETLTNSTEEQLTILWRKYLGKEGTVKALMDKIKDIPKEEKKEYGQQVNTLRNEIDKLINSAKEEIKNQKNNQYLSQSQTKLSFKKSKVGHLHPLTETMNEINTILGRIGYNVYDGPELETDEYLFQRCNVPVDHPARDLQDSIYVEEPNILLRTQTSSVETHALEDLNPPFKIVIPGKVYRNEKVNKTNHFTFHQYQLVCVQEKVSLKDLIGTIDYLFKSYLGEEVVVRYRNKYYPEVEPGLGLDQRCFNCHGVGCPICKNRGWIEMGGAGIIHPNIMRMAGVDTNKWQGFAFGLGLDRWAMSKNKITDIRTLLGGNLAYVPNVR